MAVYKTWQLEQIGLLLLGNNFKGHVGMWKWSGFSGSFSTQVYTSLPTFFFF